MYVKEVTVENQVGLHARPATFFIQKANEYKSSIWVEKEERRVNAKSLLGVLSLGIVGGTTIRIIADGADEQAAVDGLVKLGAFILAEDKFLSCALIIHRISIGAHIVKPFRYIGGIIIPLPTRRHLDKCPMILKAQRGVFFLYSHNKVEHFDAHR